MGRSRIILLLLSCFALGCFLRFYHLGKRSLWLDELIQVHRASLPLPECISAVRRDFTMPLSYLTTYFVVRVANSDFCVRVPEAMFGCLSVLLIFWLGKILFNEITGLLAAFILACSPFHIYYSQEIRFYASMIFYILLFNIVFFKAVAQKKARGGTFILLILTGVLALYTHLFSLLNIAVMIGFVFLQMAIREKSFSPRTVRYLWSILLALVLVAATFIPYYLSTRGFAAAPRSTVKIDLNWRLATQAWTSFINGYPGKQLDDIFIYVMMLGFFLLGIWHILKYDPLKALYFGAVAIIIPVVIIGAERLLSIPFFDPRHISIAFPFILLIISAGVVFFSQMLNASRRPLLHIVFWILLLGYTTVTYGKSWWTYDRFCWKDDYRSAGYFIARNIGPDDYVIAPGFLPYFEHYLRGVSKDNLIPTFWVLDREDEEKLRSGRRIWFFKSKYCNYLQFPQVRRIAEECERLPGAKLEFHFPYDHCVIVIDPQRSQEELIDEFLEADFPSPSPMVSLANILINNGEYERALRLLEKKTVYNSIVDRASQDRIIRKISAYQRLPGFGSSE